MSLKAVHLAFILLATALCVFFAAWQGGRYSETHDAMQLVWTVVSGVAAIGLLVYLRSFLRKMRGVKYL